MTKGEMRATATTRLLGRTPEARARAAARIEERIWTVPELAAARVLLVYAALPSEPPTDAIAEAGRRRGMIVTYPRCLVETREMAIHRVESHGELRSGAYGIREPDIVCPLVGLEEVDAALVPGLAWDRKGGRLGRGAGYYDRLFADPRWRGFRCGVLFAAQEVADVPTDPWDAPLDAVVTESGAWRAR